MIKYIYTYIKIYTFKHRTKIVREKENETIKNIPVVTKKSKGRIAIHLGTICPPTV